MKKNANKPKCTQCIVHNCDAGLVNHASMEYGRGRCLFDCGCTMFQIAKDEDVKLVIDDLKTEEEAVTLTLIKEYKELRIAYDKLKATSL